MDLKRFFRELPGLYDGWAGPACRPKSPRFGQLLDAVPGMTTPGVTQLLSHAVGCLEAGETYCEVGCFRGATLVGALSGHPGVRAEAVDNFSEFDADGGNREGLLANLRRFSLDSRVDFREEDFERFLAGRRSRRRPTVGVYFYDGAHDYRSQLMGLLLSVPHLAERALVVVDDANYPPVRQARWDFVAAFPPVRLALEILTPRLDSPDFWNGLHVLARERGADNGYVHENLLARREEGVVRAIAQIGRVPVAADAPGMPGSLQDL